MKSPSANPRSPNSQEDLNFIATNSSEDSTLREAAVHWSKNLNTLDAKTAIGKGGSDTLKKSKLKMNPSNFPEMLDSSTQNSNKSWASLVKPSWEESVSLHYVPFDLEKVRKIFLQSQFKTISQKDLLKFFQIWMETQKFPLNRVRRSQKTSSRRSR